MKSLIHSNYLVANTCVHIHAHTHRLLPCFEQQCSPSLKHFLDKAALGKGCQTASNFFSRKPQIETEAQEVRWASQDLIWSTVPGANRFCLQALGFYHQPQPPPIKPAGCINGPWIPGPMRWFVSCLICICIQNSQFFISSG